MVVKKKLFDRRDTYSLRGLCMIFIILHHIYQYTASRYGISYPWPLAIMLQDAGYLMTGVFFLLSGYGMFQSMAKRVTLSWDYVITHLWKLLQPFLFIFIIDVIVYSIRYTFEPELFIKNLLTLSLTDAGSLWFMKVIFCLYVIVFMIQHFIKTPTIKVFSLWLVCGAYVIITIINHVGSQWWNSILCFPLGYSLAYCNIQDLFSRLIMPRYKVKCVWG